MPCLIEQLHKESKKYAQSDFGWQNLRGQEIKQCDPQFCRYSIGGNTCEAVVEVFAKVPNTGASGTFSAEILSGKCPLNARVSRQVEFKMS